MEAASEKAVCDACHQQTDDWVHVTQSGFNLTLCRPCWDDDSIDHSQLRPSEKPKRGRPRTVGISVDARFRSYFPELTSDHGLANRHYAMCAAVALGVANHDPIPAAWSWLCPDHTEYRWKWDLLTAIGRCLNNGSFPAHETPPRTIAVQRIFAERVCELKRPVKESVRLVRQWELPSDSYAAATSALSALPRSSGE